LFGWVLRHPYWLAPGYATKVGCCSSNAQAMELLLMSKVDMLRSRKMDFSQDWRKLDDRVFATMRIHKGDLNYSADEKVEVLGPKKKFNAHVLLSRTSRLRDIPLSFLEYDLEAKPGETREKLYGKLGKRYPMYDQPKDSDTVTIYLLERL
jgi:hypothetical protein